MRTQEEIVDRIKEIKNDDMFGWEAECLMEGLDKNHVKPFLAEDTDLSKWKQLKTDKAVIGAMKKYMEFAFEKAVGHRGISASRSIHHYKGWLWLIGDQELLDFIDDRENYQNYGAPILAKIAKKYEIQLPEDKEDRRVFNAMAKGKECHLCRSGKMGGCER